MTNGRLRRCGNATLLIKDLAPITMGVNFPNVLVVHAGVKTKTFAEFIEIARKNPGKLIRLAATGPRRPPQVPQIPTIAESGFPGNQATNWYAFVASAKVPKPLLDRWSLKLVKVLKSPEVAAEFNQHGLPPQPGTCEELGAEIVRATGLDPVGGRR